MRWTCCPGLTSVERGDGLRENGTRFTELQVLTPRSWRAAGGGGEREKRKSSVTKGVSSHTQEATHCQRSGEGRGGGGTTDSACTPVEVAAVINVCISLFNC